MKFKLLKEEGEEEEGDPETEQIGSEDGYASVGQEEKRDPCEEYSGIVSRAQRETVGEDSSGENGPRCASQGEIGGEKIEIKVCTLGFRTCAP